MEEIRYYDVITKQEVSKQHIKANVPYITLGTKWKIRLTTMNKDGSCDEKFLTIEEEEEARKDILRVNLLEKGYIVNSIELREGLDIDNLHLNVANYSAEVQDRQGRRGTTFFNDKTLENLVRRDENGMHIELNNCTFQNQSLIENFSTATNESQKSTRIIVNLDQWGFKGTYDLSKKEDYARLLKDQEIMPKSKEEAMRNQNMQRE